jgi:hypothetical protein
MAGCHHGHAPTNDTLSNADILLNNLGINFDGAGLIVTLFLMGLAASFTHCLSMCGPIAVAQMSLRLMHLPKEKMTEFNKFKCALSLPYYLGKASTYSLLAVIGLKASEALTDIPYIKYITVILLVMTALIFIRAGIKRTFEAFSIGLPFKKKLDNFITNKFTSLGLNPFGFKGFLMGMVLGLLPCGIVYASMVTIISSTSNYFIAAIAMFMFGIATTPGLLLVSYVGEQLIYRNKKLFNILFTILMFFNAYLLLYYAYGWVMS